MFHAQHLISGRRCAKLARRLVFVSPFPSASPFSNLPIRALCKTPEVSLSFLRIDAFSSRQQRPTARPGSCVQVGLSPSVPRWMSDLEAGDGRTPLASTFPGYPGELQASAQYPSSNRYTSAFEPGTASLPPDQTRIEVSARGYSSRVRPTSFNQSSLHIPQDQQLQQQYPQQPLKLPPLQHAYTSGSILTGRDEAVLPRFPRPSGLYTPLTANVAQSAPSYLTSFPSFSSPYRDTACQYRHPSQTPPSAARMSSDATVISPDPSKMRPYTSPMFASTIDPEVGIRGMRYPGHNLLQSAPGCDS